MPTRLYNLFASLTPDEQLAISPFAEATMHQWSPQQRCAPARVSDAIVHGPRRPSVGAASLRGGCPGAQAVLPQRVPAQCRRGSAEPTHGERAAVHWARVGHSAACHAAALTAGPWALPSACWMHPQEFVPSAGAVVLAADSRRLAQVRREPVVGALAAGAPTEPRCAARFHRQRAGLPPDPHASAHACGPHVHRRLSPRDAVRLQRP